MRVKKYAILFLVIVSKCAGYSQDFSIPKFRAMTLNSMTMDDMVFTQNIDWSSFKQIMGTPSQEYLTSHMEGEYQIKHFEYSGAHFQFSNYLDNYEFFSVEITSQNFVFTYDGVEIKVNNNLNSLAGKFPQEYNAKSNGQMHIILEQVDGVGMTIFYNSNEEITKIELLQNFL